MAQDSYHIRRIERELPDRDDQLAVIRGQWFLSLAMARDNRPYLVALNYAFDEAANCFYVHSATEGRKLDYLRANPLCWGMIIEDGGYIVGKCSHRYRSVMFEAEAHFIKEPGEKTHALATMIDFADPDPGPLKERLLQVQKLATVTVIRLKVLSMGGKRGA